MISSQSGVADGIAKNIATKTATQTAHASAADCNPLLPDANLAVHPGATVVPAAPARSASRRRISPASGRALECLGHAIEYLADEYCLSLGRLGLLEPADPRVEAIQLLMSLNRQIYYACPEIEPAYRRLARWIFRLHAVPEAHSKQPLN